MQIGCTALNGNRSNESASACNFLAERDQQQLMQAVGLILPRVSDFGKPGDELFHEHGLSLNPIGPVTS